MNNKFCEYYDNDLISIYAGSESNHTSEIPINTYLITRIILSSFQTK